MDLLKMSTCLTYYTALTAIPDITSEVNVCLGVGETTLSGWSDVLQTQSCGLTLYQYIWGSTINPVFNLSRFNEVQDGMEYALSKYFSKLTGDTISNHLLTNTGQIGYNPFQEQLLNLCRNPSLPGICSKAQNKMCASCTQRDVGFSSISDFISFCGCHLPADAITVAVNPATTSLVVPPECYPMCAAGTTIKNAKTDGSPLMCNSSVCVMNNINIASTLAQVGSISFTQVCPQCGEGGNGTCICIIDTSVTGIAKTLGIDSSISFNQYCGANSICLTVNSTTGAYVPTACATSLDQIQPTTYNFGIPKWVWYVAICIIFLGILVIFSSLYESKRKVQVYRKKT
jgi:hypothetical protein